MRAVGLRHYGGPEVLELVQIPTPEPGAGVVRVRVHAAAINPADVMLRDGLLADSYVDVEPPFIPGMDVAGVIDALGPDLDPALDLELGQRVAGIVETHAQHGGYSEFLVLPTESVTSAPVGASTAEAATSSRKAAAAPYAIALIQAGTSSTHPRSRPVPTPMPSVPAQCLRHQFIPDRRPRRSPSPARHRLGMHGSAARKSRIIRS